MSDKDPRDYQQLWRETLETERKLREAEAQAENATTIYHLAIALFSVVGVAAIAALIFAL
jgi:hypothetical protein